jgi:peptide deformylase
MAKTLEVLKYPNPILRRGGEDVEAFDADLAAVAADMLRTMYEYRGVGLAAPQVGKGLNLLVLNPTGDPEDTADEQVLVNPKILSRKKMEYGEEGCLSFPGIYAEVERHSVIKVSYHDLQGEGYEMELDDFMARIVLHEMDHLQGVLFVDRLSAAERIRVRSKLLELERAWQPD